MPTRSQTAVPHELVESCQDVGMKGGRTLEDHGEEGVRKGSQQNSWNSRAEITHMGFKVFVF